MGGWRIIDTLGKKVTGDITPPQGFSAEASGATLILGSSYFGYPLSTTQVVSGAVVGSGIGRGESRVNWGIAGRMGIALGADHPGRRRRCRGRLRDRLRCSATRPARSWSARSRWPARSRCSSRPAARTRPTRSSTSSRPGAGMIARGARRLGRPRQGGARRPRSAASASSSPGAAAARARTHAGGPRGRADRRDRRLRRDGAASAALHARAAGAGAMGDHTEVTAPGAQVLRRLHDAPRARARAAARDPGAARRGAARRLPRRSSTRTWTRRARTSGCSRDRLPSSATATARCSRASSSLVQSGVAHASARRLTPLDLLRPRDPSDRILQRARHAAAAHAANIADYRALDRHRRRRGRQRDAGARRPARRAGAATLRRHHRRDPRAHRRALSSFTGALPSRASWP